MSVEVTKRLICYLSGRVRVYVVHTIIEIYLSGGNKFKNKTLSIDDIYDGE